MRATPTPLPGALVIEPVVHGDERGFFQETFRADLMRELGVAETWVQDNHSRSARDVPDRAPGAPHELRLPVPEGEVHAPQDAADRRRSAGGAP